MIVQNCITIRDEDGDMLTVEEQGDTFMVSDADGCNVLVITQADAAALIQFFKRYGVSA